MLGGIIHVGAHVGQEVPEYLSSGYSPIICFEPQMLSWEHDSVILVWTALGDKDGILIMRVPHHLHDTPERDTQSASALPLIHENAIANGWTPTPWDEIIVPVIRFDTWAQDNDFVRGSCSTLNIDVQGMEMHVLVGFGDYLQDFDSLKIECSEPPIYNGGAYASEVVEFLNKQGFYAESPVVRHGDIRFKRRK